MSPSPQDAPSPARRERTRKGRKGEDVGLQLVRRTGPEEHPPPDHFAPNSPRTQPKMGRTS